MGCHPQRLGDGNHGVLTQRADCFCGVEAQTFLLRC
jgi:hypothetical protein